jgi:hypothetical protein
MPNNHGGQRTPAHPAPVSGPGALSRRTDGGPTSQPPMVANGGPYGSRQEMESIQSGSPLQGGGGGNTAPAGPTPADMIPFGAPTTNPGEPVTAGADAGPGISSQAAGITSDSDATLQQLAPLVRSLEAVANLPTATPETRAYVRALKARLAGG